MKRTNLPRAANCCPRCHEWKKQNQAYCTDCEDLETCRPHIYQWAGYRVCPRCLELGKTRQQATFWSQHCRKITRCEDCQKWMTDVENSLGLYGHRYDVLEKQANGSGSFDGVRQKLQQHVGGRMNALKQAAIYANEHTKAIVGIEYRRLTKEEIAREYPPERIEAILLQAQRNWDGNKHVPELVQL